MALKQFVKSVILPAPEVLSERIEQAKLDLLKPGQVCELEEVVVRGQRYRNFKNGPQNLSQLIKQSLKEYPTRECVVYQKERYSYKEVYEQAQLAAATLLKQGLKPGDPIGICSRNYPEWIVAFIAIFHLGGVAVPMNSWWQERELEYGITHSRMKAIFVDGPRLKRIAAKLPQLGIKTYVFREQGALPDGVMHFQDALKVGYKLPRVPVAKVDNDDDAIIMYTSGTTGNPKGVQMTHRSVCQALLAVGHIEHSLRHALGFLSVLLPKPAQLLAVPLFHVTGTHAVLLSGLMMGRKTVIMHKWDPLEALQTIPKEKITHFTGVPTMILEIIGHPDIDKYDTSSLIIATGGGAPSPPSMFPKILAKLPGAQPGQGYGMTETNALTTACTGISQVKHPKSCGKAQPVVDLRVVGDAGQVLGPGERGELCVRGPTVMKGYLHDEANTKKTFMEDGWLLTGDVAIIDKEGYVYIVDRAKELIIRGGENISNAEVEAAAYEHDSVAECAAFGIPDERLGEEVALAVFLKPDAPPIDANTLRDFIKERVAHFKVPKVIEFIPTQLPRGPTGKIVRRIVKEKYLEMVNGNGIKAKL
mmetsp:Transcript_35638/g.42927  ORF Transcript_35638/g.42927 Transcript_35638/m.42927 type:complete len:589 (+) Transcript_35638:95-1861(+)|eukprot:CAMPEP_0197851128 /NCGR_PEP_ID=MMETSP1438-20131217/17344_1 /TAXON_ID=1461541 /ORGANISM="Pterosperma sp., Strain CCMP1384" /LENGTH=588 /DNA_ID=CAMNT_0043464621 /DNA_START=95 /DNA_END=1861 /DNA_ORIENTATION=+